jgi:hypothetical protein
LPLTNERKVSDYKKKPNTHSKSTIDSKKIEKTQDDKLTPCLSRLEDPSLNFNFFYNPSQLSTSKQASVEVIDFDFQRLTSTDQKSLTKSNFRSSIENFKYLNLAETVGGASGNNYGDARPESASQNDCDNSSYTLNMESERAKNCDGRSQVLT